MLTSLLITSLVTVAPLQVSRIRTLEMPHALAYAAAPSGARFAASLEDYTVRIIDAGAGKGVATLKGHPQQVYGLAFNKAGTTLATGDESGRIWLWNTKTGAKTKEFTREKAHIRGIQSLSFSADGKQLASTGKDDVIIIWDVASGKPIKKILGNGANVVSATYSPKGGSLIYGTIGTGLHIVKTGSYAEAGSMSGSSGGLNELCLGSGGSRAIGGDHGNQLVVWDLASRKRIGAVKGHDDMVMHVAVSPNGRMAASSANDRKVIVWDLTGFTKAAEIPDQSAIGSPLAFTADGKYLVTASVSDNIQIYSLSPSQGGSGGSGSSGGKKKRRRG